MDYATRRAAMLAADKLLAASGYDIKGLDQRAAAMEKKTDAIKKRAELIADGKIAPKASEMKAVRRREREKLVRVIREDKKAKKKRNGRS